MCKKLQDVLLINKYSYEPGPLTISGFRVLSISPIRLAISVFPVPRIETHDKIIWHKLAVVPSSHCFEIKMVNNTNHLKQDGQSGFMAKA